LGQELGLLSPDLGRSAQHVVQQLVAYLGERVDQARRAASCGCATLVIAPASSNRLSAGYSEWLCRYIRLDVQVGRRSFGGSGQREAN
jgi:hypothetical protein